MHALLLLADLGLGLLQAIVAALDALFWLLEPLEVIVWLGERCGLGRAAGRRAARQTLRGARGSRAAVPVERRRRRRCRPARRLRAAG